MARSRESAIVAADVTQGGVLVHFSDGDSVLFRASFLSANRAQDGNVIVPLEIGEKDEIFIIPDEI